MAEIRFSIREKLGSEIRIVAEELGVSDAEYVRSLILEDMLRTPDARD